MSQLIINFDSTLEVKPIDDRKKGTDLIEQKTLNFNNPNNFYSEYEFTSNLIQEDSCNNLVNTFLAAYNSHKPLRLPRSFALSLPLPLLRGRQRFHITLSRPTRASPVVPVNTWLERRNPSVPFLSSSWFIRVN